MVLYLKEELIQHCRLLTATPKNLDIFDHFAQVGNRGFHFLIGDRKLIEILAGMTRLEPKTRMIYISISKNYTSHYSILNSVNFFAKVGCQSSQKTNDFIEVNIDQMHSDLFLGRNKLLLENSNDAKVYGYLVNYYRDQSKSQEVLLNWDVVNGGGSTSSSEFERITSEELCYTFSLLDSDKKSPYDTVGSTANEFIISIYDSVFGDYEVLPVHEMENLIPSKLIQSSCYSDANYRRNRSIIDNFHSDVTCNATHYMDIKKGVSRHGLRNLNEQCRNYWLSWAEKFSKPIENCDCTSSACTHFLVYPFGGDFVKKTLALAKKLGIVFSEILDEFYKKIWFDIGKLLFDRFCSPPRNAFEMLVK